MGMDIFGKVAPCSANDGEHTWDYSTDICKRCGVKRAYFRNNYWWWRPVARYIQAMHPDLYAKCQYWESNDGDGLNADDAKELGRRLLEDVAIGRVENYAKTRSDGLPQKGDYAYPFSVENVKKFGEFCIASGGFEIF